MTSSTDSLREFLTKKLATERPTMEANEGLYLATLPLAFIDPDTLKALGNRVKALPINLARVAVDEVALRCQVTGFRSSPGDVVDDDLLKLWGNLRLPESAQLAQLDALVLGRAYFLAWVGATGETTITAESPLQFTVTRDPVTREIVGALKRYRDAEGFTRSMVITATEIAEYASRSAVSHDVPFTSPLNFTGEDMLWTSTIPNPLGRVPVVALVNRPRLTAPDGESELSDLEAPVRAISKLCSDLMVSSEYAAIPRRWITVSAAMNATQAGEVQDSLSATAASPAGSRFMVIGGSSEQAHVGTFEVAQLENFRTGIELLVDAVAAIASLPTYFVRGGMANPTSADAIRSSEFRLTMKSRQRHSWWGPAYADLMRLAVTLRDGIEDARLGQLETLWRDPAPSTTAQTADAVSKTFGAGIIDQRAALTEMGISPLEIERIMSTTSKGIEVA